MAISPKLPSMNQLLNLVIALAIVSFVFKLMPENYRQYFRI